VLRIWNTVGKPIRRELRMADVRLITDAGTTAGWRIDGRERSMPWIGYSRAVAMDWSEEEESWDMWQVHKELWVLHKMMEIDGHLVQDRSVLVYTDCKGVAAYVNKGMGSSDVMMAMISLSKIWRLALLFGVKLHAEWMPGAQMVISGTDGLSRMQEFKVRPAEFQKLHRSQHWGRYGGFAGYGVDLMATAKTRQGKLPYGQRGGGENSLGDARTMKLDPMVNYWCVPPIPLISVMIQRLEEAQVAATVVVPAWKGQPYWPWLLERGIKMKELVAGNGVGCVGGTSEASPYEPMAVCGI
jgi:hypothetical protein